MVFRGSRRTTGTKNSGLFSRGKNRQSQNGEQDYREEAMRPLYRPEQREDSSWQGQNSEENHLQQDLALNFFGLEFGREPAPPSAQQRIIYSLPNGLPTQLVVNEDEASIASSTISESMATNESSVIPATKSSGRQRDLDNRINQIIASSTDESDEDFFYQQQTCTQLPKRRSVLQNIFRKSTTPTIQEEGRQQSQEYSSSSNEDETAASTLSMLSGSTSNGDSIVYLHERARAISESDKRKNRNDVVADFKNNEQKTSAVYGASKNLDRNESEAVKAKKLTNNNTESKGKAEEENEDADQPPSYQNAILQSFGGGFAGIFGTGGIWASSNSADQVEDKATETQVEPEAEPEQDEQEEIEQIQETAEAPEATDHSRFSCFVPPTLDPSPQAFVKQKRRPFKLLFCGAGGVGSAKDEAMKDERQIETQNSMLTDDDMNRTVVSSSGQIERLTDEESQLLREYRQSKNQLTHRSGSKSSVAFAEGLPSSPESVLEFSSKPSIKEGELPILDAAAATSPASNPPGPRLRSKKQITSECSFDSPEKHDTTPANTRLNVEERAMYASPQSPVPCKSRKSARAGRADNSGGFRDPTRKSPGERQTGKSKLASMPKRFETGNAFSESKNSKPSVGAPENEKKNQSQQLEIDTDTDEESKPDRYVPASHQKTRQAFISNADTPTTRLTDTDDDEEEEQDRYLPAQGSKQASIPNSLPKKSWRKEYLKKHNRTTDHSVVSESSSYVSEYLSSPRLASLEDILRSDSERRHISYKNKLSRASQSFWKSEARGIFGGKDNFDGYDGYDSPGGGFSSSGDSDCSSLEAYSVHWY